MDIRHRISGGVEKNVTLNPIDSKYRNLGWHFFRNDGNEAHLWAMPMWEMEMSLDETTVFKHKVLKMEVKVPKDSVQRHLSNGRVVLYTMSFSPGEWEEVGTEGIAE